MKQKELVSVFKTALSGLFIATLVMVSTCHKPIDLEPFKELARNADCADISNRLFLIDKKMVFWDRQGNCPDNRFAQILFRRSPEDELCSRKDSIAGPIVSCKDEEFQELFETIIDNLDQDDLGLGPDHQVEPISF
ncbi:MAG: hypothetical protein ACFFCW_19795 [Candidatus Hodarchaeota archaeon]